jgi:hypothetical protein
MFPRSIHRIFLLVQLQFGWRRDRSSFKADVAARGGHNTFNLRQWPRADQAAPALSVIRWKCSTSGFDDQRRRKVLGQWNCCHSRSNAKRSSCFQPKESVMEVEAPR